MCDFFSIFHSEFRLRFRSDGNQSTDDWFVDDVFVGIPKDPVEPPENDNCADAIVLTQVLTPFTSRLRVSIRSVGNDPKGSRTPVFRIKT